MTHLTTETQSAELLATNYRACIHACSIFIPVLVETTSRLLTVAALCVVTAIYVAGELQRLRGRRVPLLSEFTLRMGRPNEKDHFIAPPVFLALGIILVLLIFPRNIAYASIAIVAIGDPLAAYVGGRFGRRHVGRKSLEGFTIGTFAAFALTLFLVPPSVGAIGSMVGMILELAGVLDDNLTIPLGSGTAMYLATALLMHASV
jgi:dolichol kinase